MIQAIIYDTSNNHIKLKPVDAFMGAKLLYRLKVTELKIFQGALTRIETMKF